MTRKQTHVASIRLKFKAGGLKGAPPNTFINRPLLVCCQQWVDSKTEFIGRLYESVLLNAF